MSERTVPATGFARSSTSSSDVARWGTLIAGGLLAVYGLSRRSPAGALLAAMAGGLAYAGARPETFRRPSVAFASMLVNAKAEDAYRFWRDFEELPTFMRHIASVSKLGDRRTRWTAAGPMGAEVTWDAEIVGERENEYIAWRSLPESEIEVDGWVRFRPAPGNRGTIISARLVIKPTAGRLATIAARMLGRDPSFLMRQDLRRLKALMEAGEIPSVEGQPHGPRSLKVGVARAINPDEPVRGEAGILEVMEARRRAS